MNVFISISLALDYLSTNNALMFIIENIRTTLDDNEFCRGICRHEKINSEQMHTRLEQPPKNIKTKLPNDEEIRP